MDLQKRFPVGQQIDVYVTHVHDESGHFFMQINNEEAGKLDELMEEIEQFISSGESQSLTAGDIDIGAVYLAQYSVDAKWYRARVVAVKPTGVCDVHFIDYGNTEQIPVKFVRHAQAAFLRLHPQAFECELDGMKNFQGPSLKSAISTMSPLILEQELVGIPSAINGEVLTLKLYTDANCSSSILDSLLSQVQRTPQSAPPSTIPATSANRKYATLDLSTDTYLDFHVSHVQDPFNFSCQLLEEIPKILELLDELAEEYSEEDVPLLSSNPGYPCCAKFYEDDCWYRAVITNSSAVASGTVDVKFIDYGNSQSTSLKDVKGLKDKHLEIPVQAVECSLHGIRPSGNSTEWSAQAKELFSKLTSEKHIIAQICGRDANEKYLVQLIDMTGDMEMQLDQILIAAKYAEKVGNTLLTSTLSERSSTPAQAPTTALPKATFPFTRQAISPGKEEKVLVASVTSPASFYCMMYRTSSSLEKLMSDIARHYSGLGHDDEWLSTPSVGDPCCAKFSEDKSWYRAVVKEVHSSGKVKVQFVDYGNYDTVVAKDVKRLAPKFSELPCQGIECSLHRICPNGPDWKHADIKKFEDIALEYSGKLTVISVNDDGVKNVELVITQKGKEVNSAEAMLVSGNARLAEGAMAQTENLASVSSKKFAKLNLPLGTYEDIFVTHIEDPGSFWCQLIKHKDELDAVMNAIEEHCSSSSPLRSPSLGLCCCAQYSDEAWYRANITGVLKNQQVEVHFVDYGNYDTVSQSSLRPMKPELMNLPAQAFKCRLEQIDVKNTPPFSDEVIEKFTDLTMDKELVGMISSYDDSCEQYLISCTDTSAGNTLDIYEQIASQLPHSSIKECVVPKQDLKVGRREHVCITSVTGPSNFYCQLMRTASQLDNLMVSIDEHYSKLTANQEEMTGLQPGNNCVARYTEDDSWYRAKVVDIKSNSQVSVHYIDFGNGEDVTANAIKRLSQSFAQLPEQVIKCRLAGEISGLSDTQFVELTLDKEFDMEIVSVDDQDGAVVNLYTRDTKQPVIQLLTKEKPKATTTIQQSSFTINTTETVVVSFAKDVSKFYVQACKSADSLGEMMDLIHEYYSTLTEEQDIVDEPRIDLYCVANFSEDDGWYRAKITAVYGNSVEVFYVDYGNSEVLPVSRLKTLKPDFASLPCQAVQCELSGVQGINKEEISSKFLKIVEDPEMQFDLQVVSLHTGNVHEAVLISKETGAPVNDEFASKQTPPAQSKAAGPAKLSSIPLTTGQAYNGQCGAATSPSEFWFSLNSYVDDLNNLLDSLAEHYTSLSPSDDVVPFPSVGSYCCCQYSEDQGWYRAKVVSIDGSHAEVLFVDFGNSENVELNALKVLKEEFQTLPKQAIKCSLNKANPNNNNTWSEEAKTVFIDTILEKDSAIKLIQKLSDDTHLVDLVDTNGEDFALNVLISKGFAVGSSSEASSKDFKPFVMDFSVGDFIDVNPSYCKTPDDFNCQVLTENNIVTFNHMTGQLQQVYSALSSSDNSISTPTVGMVCCALYSDDNTWNRARIMQVVDNTTVKVQFVDYGNEETMSLNQVKELQAEFLVLPVQCAQCCLSAVSPSRDSTWSEEAVQRFLNLVDQKYLVAKIINKDASKVSLDLYDTQDDNIDVNIAQVLVNEKHAISTSLQLQPTEQQSLPQTSHPKLSQLSQLKPLSEDIVYITAVDSPNSVFCQVSGTEERIDSLMANLKEFCESGEALPVQDISPNELCLALFSEDNTWYRAVIKEVSPEGIVVRFIDYGNTDSVTLDKIRAFDSKFLSEQVLAVECKLSGVKPVSENAEWSDDAVDFLTNAGGDDGFVVTVISTNNGLEVTLSDQNGDLSQRLIQEGLARSNMSESTKSETAVAESVASPVEQKSTPQTTHQSLPQTTHPKLSQLSQLKPLSEDIVYITAVDSPNSVFCQVSGTEERIDSLMANLKEFCESGEALPVEDISPNELCLALFSEDNTWYRAVTEEVSPEGIVVRFIDYGNTDSVTLDKIRAFDSKFLTEQILAVECKLSGVKPVSENAEWSDDAVEFLTNAGGDDGFVVTVISTNNGLEVTLSDQNGDLSQRLIQEGLARSNMSEGTKSETAVAESIASQPSTSVNYQLPVVNVGKTMEVYITDVTSPGQFYCQLADYGNSLDEMMDNINTYYNNTDRTPAIITSPREGHPCVAVFKEDNMWYRARIETLSNNDATIRFIDYGNTQQAKISDLQEIDSQFLQLPALAVACTLGGQKSSWTTEDTEMFKTATGEEKLTAEVTGQERGKYAVRILQDGNCVTDSLLQETAVHHDIPTQVLQPNQTEDVYVVFAKSSSEICVQLSSYSDQLDQAMATIEHACGSNTTGLQAENVIPGMPCCAFFEDAWYRAVVTSAQSQGQVTVEYVDYGNKATVALTELRVIPASCTTLPRQAIHCVLDGTGLEAVSKETLENTLMDTPLSACFIKSDGSQWIVQLKQDNVDVVDMLLGEPAVVSTQAEPMSYTWAKLSTDQAADVKFLMTEGDNTIWLQPVATENDLVALMHNIAENPPSQPLPVSQITNCKPCLCKFTEDDEWYRAEIIEHNDGQVTVKYVDYGNTEAVETSRISDIGEALVDLPAQAIKCHLNGVESLAEELTNKLNEEYVEVQLKAEVTEQKDGVYSIKLYEVDGKELISNLTDATNDETSKEPVAVTRQRSLDDQQLVTESTTDKVEDNEENAEGNSKDPENSEQKQEIADVSELNSKESSSQSVEDTTEEEEKPTEKEAPLSPEVDLQNPQEVRFYKTESPAKTDEESMQPLSQEKVETEKTNHTETDLTAEELTYYLQEPGIGPESSETETPAEKEESATVVEMCTTSETTSSQNQPDDDSHTELIPHTENSTLGNDNIVESDSGHLKSSEVKVESGQVQSGGTKNESISEAIDQVNTSEEFSSTLQKDVPIDEGISSTENVKPEGDKKGLIQEFDIKAETDGIENDALKDDNETNLDSQMADVTEAIAQSYISPDDRNVPVQNIEKKDETEPSKGDGVLTEDKELKDDNKQPDIREWNVQSGPSSNNKENVTQDIEEKDATDGSVVLKEDEEINQDITQKADETRCNLHDDVFTEGNKDLSQANSGDVMDQTNKNSKKCVNDSSQADENVALDVHDEAELEKVNPSQDLSESISTDAQVQKAFTNGDTIPETKGFGDIIRNGCSEDTLENTDKLSSAQTQDSVANGDEDTNDFDTSVPCDSKEDSLTNGDDLGESQAKESVPEEEGETQDSNSIATKEDDSKDSNSDKAKDASFIATKDDPQDSNSDEAKDASFIATKDDSKDSNSDEAKDASFIDTKDDSKDSNSDEAKDASSIATKDDSQGSNSDEAKDTSSIPKKDDSRDSYSDEAKDTSSIPKKDDSRASYSDEAKDTSVIPKKDDPKDSYSDEAKDTSSIPPKDDYRDLYSDETKDTSSIPKEDDSKESNSKDYSSTAPSNEYQEDDLDNTESFTSCCDVQEAISNDSSVVQIDDNQEQPIVVPSVDKEAKDNSKVSSSLEKEKDGQCENELMSKEVKNHEDVMNGKHEPQEFKTDDECGDKDVEKATNGHVNGQEITSQDIDNGLDNGTLKKAAGLPDNHGVLESDIVEEKKKSCKPM